MHQKKGIDLILKALTRLPGVYLWVAGDGPKMNEYKKLSEKLGISNRVRFLGWRTDRQSLLEKCDICVLPSRYEPFGTVMVEAWAAKRLLVTSHASGARQYVKNKFNGIVFEIDNINELVDAINLGLMDDNLKEYIIQNAYSEYLQKFTKEVSVKNLVSTYRKIAKAPVETTRLVNSKELNKSLIYKIQKDILELSRIIDKSRALDAAIVFLSYLNYSMECGEVDRDYAADAAILQISGAVNTISTRWPNRMVLIIDQEGLDFALSKYNLHEKVTELDTISKHLRTLKSF
jgi:hypothetical protein